MALNGPPAASINHAHREPISAGVQLRRIYWPAPYGTTATTFRHNGPRARFDHHRRRRPFPAADEDADRGIFYCAPTFECCVFECFGDDFVIDPDGARLTVLTTIEPLVLLDIRGQAAVDAGTLAAINADGDREITQDWARWWYEHPALGDLDGLLFEGAHNDEEALALFERTAGKFEPTFDQPLDGPDVIGELLVFAARFDFHLDSSRV